ncbi:MAG TPA: spermidine/putrescine ABC transporter substrate-binding protein [Clostridiales bacterium]|nr:spermidine/putrescine ABC transporter substrate-binding protein [Clostridiales bacterium]
MKRILALTAAAVCAASALSLAGCAESPREVVLRVCSWEEYIDLGGWAEDELIDIDNPFGDGEGIFGENSMVDDFTEWFNSNHDYKVRVEYSTFGTNEDLYNRLSLGDEYDLVCPSDYLLMKLIAEGKAEKFSDSFRTGEHAYYEKYVSPYIDGIFEKYGWNEYAAGYMWGTTGLVYNPEKVMDEKDVASWNVLLNEDYKRQVTIKDNVRDAYFATLGIINSEKLLSGEFSENELSVIMNDTDGATIEKAQEVLKNIKENVYSFETDAGKSDMVTGKVIANYQWSGDAVYIMDEAESDESETELWYSVPEECANLWFDGWVMLKDGVGGDERRKEAAESFVNFLSRPDNAVRNMYYIGYTSAVAGQTVFDYMEWNYGAEEDAEVYEYDLSYFFGDGDFTVEADKADFGFAEDGVSVNRGRQLFAQYPPEEVIKRSVVMLDFGDKLGEINRMWINVRCLDVKDIPIATVCIIAAVIIAVVAGALLYAFRYKLFIKDRVKK